MCLFPVKIRGVHLGSPARLFVPCGHCDQCRRVEKSGWSFRLGLELEKKLEQGFEIGFCTLTYNNEHIPKIPFECFRYGYEYEEIPCFDKNQCRKFIRNLRTKLFDLYRVTGLIYFLGSEFGERRGRPHYHFLVCYNPKQINYRQMHGLIKELWKENGYIFPSTPDPKRVYEDGVENSFKVDTSIGAYLCAKYVTKYVCKDVGFNKILSSKTFVDKQNQGVRVPKFNLFGVLETEKDGSPKFETSYQVFLRCRPFHLQSRSLGWSYIQNMTSINKLDALKKGLKFLGEEHRQKLPVYIKNKIIFDNRYVLEYDKQGNEKRRVIREANSFFLENAETIFRLKVEGYEKLFTSLREESYWVSRKAAQSTFRLCDSSFDCLCNCYGMSINDIARYFLAYYAVPLDRCYDGVNIVNQWLQRYNDDFDFSGYKQINKEFKEDVDDLITTIFYCMSELSTDDDLMTKKVNQYKKRKKERCLERVNR